MSRLRSGLAARLATAIVLAANFFVGTSIGGNAPAPQASAAAHIRGAGGVSLISDGQNQQVRVTKVGDHTFQLQINGNSVTVQSDKDDAEISLPTDKGTQSILMQFE